VYKRTGTIWAQEAYIKPPGFTSTALADDYLLSYGYNLAIDGDTFIIGVRSEDSDHTTITNGTTVVTNTNGVDSGAAWVFRRTGTTWAMEAFIKPSNNGPGMTEFGRGAISISGDTIAIGAAWTSSAGTTITNGSIAPVNSGIAQSGAVYVYKRTGTTWAQEAFLKAPNSRPAIYFGSSVAISGNVIAAGAYNDDNSVAGVYNSTSIPFSGGMAGAGGVYTFYRVGSSWAWESYLKSPNPDSGDYFGNNVSLSGNTLAVTASYEASCAGGIINGTTASANNSCAGAGALYVFTRQ